MRNRPSYQKSNSKSVAPDLIARLGFLSVKSQEPISCEIDEFAVEQFFANYENPELSCILTADHIEHGFYELAKASCNEKLRPLKDLLEQLFMFAFTNIIANDGLERSRLFVERQSKFTSFPTEFIEALKNTQPNDIDNNTEISEFLMNPADIEFEFDFYVHLNQFLKEKPIPGSIYLLKHFLHNEVSNGSQISLSKLQDNRQIDVKYRHETFSMPFHESNIPEPHHNKSGDFRQNRIRSFAALTKKSTVKPPNLPSLTSITVPRYAYTAALDPTSTARCFTYSNDIFYVSAQGEMTKLRSHLHPVSAISFSGCGQFLLSADCCGEIQIQSVVDHSKFSTYQSAQEGIATVTFHRNIFAVGTINGHILIYETNNRKPLRILFYHKSSIVFLEIHPNCEYIASVSTDMTIRVGSITQAICVRLWKCLTNIPMSARFSHDGKLLMVSCSEGNIYIYNVGSTELVRSMPIEAALIDAVFSPNDKMIAVTDKSGGFSLWDTIDTGEGCWTVLRIDQLKPVSIMYLDNDEIRIIGNLVPESYFDETLRY